MEQRSRSGWEKGSVVAIDRNTAAYAFAHPSRSLVRVRACGDAVSALALVLESVSAGKTSWADALTSGGKMVVLVRAC